MTDYKKTKGKSQESKVKKVIKTVVLIVSAKRYHHSA